jgi:hypothetical protein
VCPVSTNAVFSNGECNGKGAGANKAVGNTVRGRGLVRADGCMEHCSRGRSVATGRQTDGFEGPPWTGILVKGLLKPASGRLTCRIPRSVYGSDYLLAGSAEC